MNRTSMSTYSLSSYIKNILWIMDCSSFKTSHELGLDPCERGRFISSIIIIYVFAVLINNIIKTDLNNKYNDKFYLFMNIFILLSVTLSL